jgi:catalase
MTIDHGQGGAPATTDDAGHRAPSDEFSLSAGPEGPLLLQDNYLLQKMAHFNRERVPEHVVHAKGHGAFGFFEATEDVSDLCMADFLRKGTRTPLLARFSTVAGEQGFADTVRDPRGFALKFYTQEGNYDLVGNNTPVFFIRDPSKFSDFIHSQKRRADTGRTDHNGQWDFWTLSPESAHQVVILMSDRGTPRTLRHMHGFGSHTFLWVNAAGAMHWVKFHFKTEQGIENFSESEAKAMTAEDPDFHRADLWDSIARGDAPEWRLEVQVMPYEDAADYRFNPFDVTKVWPHQDYPPVTVGRMVLDRNPDSYFAQIEQAAFEPSNFVPGIGPSPDKMLQGRLFSYPDAHRYRIGPNYLHLPVNQPAVPVHSYNQDGPMAYAFGSDPVYAPNSAGGPVAAPAPHADPNWTMDGEVIRAAYQAHREDDDFGQAGALVRNVMTDTDRAHLVHNVVAHALNGPGLEPQVAERVGEYWRSIDPDVGASVAKELGSGTPH